MSLNLNKIFFKKYKVKKLIRKDKYSIVYEGKIINDNTPICMKFERKTNFDLLETEAYCLYNLKGFGIPKFITFGKNGLYNILIMELLGLSINKIWELKKVKKEYLLKNVCMLALQGLDRLEYIHSKNYIHRDIKPSNLVIGRKDPNIIYLVDFGFSCKYRSSHSGKHIKFKKLNYIIGSLEFSSINGNKAYQQSRRDDLESFGYMIISAITKELPWDKIYTFKMDKEKLYKEVCQKKESTLPEKLCKGLPEEFSQYIKYCRNLEFEQEPNYEYLRGLFTKILIRIHQKNDLNFFWIIKNKSKEKNEEDIKGNINFKKRNSSKKRLYNQIKKSLERKKTYEKSGNNTNLGNKTISTNNLRTFKNDISLNDGDISDFENKMNFKSPNKVIQIPSEINKYNYIYKKKFLTIDKSENKYSFQKPSSLYHSKESKIIDNKERNKEISFINKEDEFKPIKKIKTKPIIYKTNFNNNTFFNNINFNNKFNLINEYNSKSCQNYNKKKNMIKQNNIKSININNVNNNINNTYKKININNKIIKINLLKSQSKININNNNNKPIKKYLSFKNNHQIKDLNNISYNIDNYQNCLTHNNSRIINEIYSTINPIKYTKCLNNINSNYTEMKNFTINYTDKYKNLKNYNLKYYNIS